MNMYYSYHLKNRKRKERNDRDIISFSLYQSVFLHWILGASGLQLSQIYSSLSPTCICLSGQKNLSSVGLQAWWKVGWEWRWGWVKSQQGPGMFVAKPRKSSSLLCPGAPTPRAPPLQSTPHPPPYAHLHNGRDELKATNNPPFPPFFLTSEHHRLCTFSSIPQPQFNQYLPITSML